MVKETRINRLLRILVIVTSLYYVFSLKGPQITHISFNQTVSRGDTVEFNCTVSDVENYSVVWAKLDSKEDWNPTYITASQTVIVADPRISVRYQNSTSSYILKLNDVQQEDEGVYACQMIISVDNKIISAKTKLTVK